MLRDWICSIMCECELSTIPFAPISKLQSLPLKSLFLGTWTRLTGKYGEIIHWVIYENDQ